MSIPLKIHTPEDKEKVSASPGYVLLAGPRSPSGTLMMERYGIRVVCGTANPKLAEDVCKHLDIEMTKCNIGRFSDGEIKMQVTESVRGHDLFVIQPCSPPFIHDSLQELCLLSHTLRLASASRVTLVVPYLGYSRQDSKQASRTPIGALVVAKQMLCTEPNRFLFVDLHTNQSQGFFGNTPTDHLSGVWVFAGALSERFPPDMRKQEIVVVSPDAAGVGRVRSLADWAGITNVAVIIMRTVPGTNGQEEKRQLVGDVANRVCLVFDDIIDKGDRSVESANVLFAAGAKQVYAAATHGIFSDGCIDKINASRITKVWVTDTLAQDEHMKKCPKLEVISVAPAIAAAISAIHEDRAVSTLKGWQSCKLAHW